MGFRKTWSAHYWRQVRRTWQLSAIMQVLTTLDSVYFCYPNRYVKYSSSQQVWRNGENPEKRLRSREGSENFKVWRKKSGKCRKFIFSQKIIRSEIKKIIPKLIRKGQWLSIMGKSNILRCFSSSYRLCLILVASFVFLIFAEKSQGKMTEIIERSGNSVRVGTLKTFVNSPEVIKF